MVKIIESPARLIVDRQFDRQEAVEHLRKADRRLGIVIDQVGSFSLKLELAANSFEAVAESIVYQQLTGKAAATIFGRVTALCNTKSEFSATGILNLSDQDLRACGLSASKTSALKDLAARAQSGAIPSFKAMRSMSDEEIIECLSQTRGVGRWTAEMILIFTLGRPDVLPLNDYGVRKGFAFTYKKKVLPTPAELAEKGQRWKPFRSIASWYLWRACELK